MELWAFIYLEVPFRESAHELAEPGIARRSTLRLARVIHCEVRRSCNSLHLFLDSGQGILRIFLFRLAFTF